MILEHLDFALAPFRAVRNKLVKLDGVRGGLRVEAGRVQQLGRQAAARAAEARALGARVGLPPAGAGRGLAATPRAIRGRLWWRRCDRCVRRLDRRWDRCPYCTHGPGPALATLATLAVASDGGRARPGHEQLGWLVPLEGSARGAVLELAEVTVIGSGPGCELALTDPYVSSRHAEVRLEAGAWRVRDLGSTNGTYVNDRRIDQHELVDNDLIRFGTLPTKFKAL